MTPFNKPYLSGKEILYLEQAVKSGKISGNGMFTKKYHSFFEGRYSFRKCLLTTSCTAALEMTVLLLAIQPGEEVIMLSYTFVSTANAFVLRGAKIVFADSRPDHPGIDEDSIEELITSKTKALVPVHYAGVACDMDKIMSIANSRSLFVAEDSAQAIDSYYAGKDGIKRPLGRIGHLAAFSFHETKNIQSVFHYLSLHQSPFYKGKHNGMELPESDRYSDCLLRLPFFYELAGKDSDFIIQMLQSN